MFHYLINFQDNLIYHPNLFISFVLLKIIISILLIFLFFKGNILSIILKILLLMIINLENIKKTSFLKKILNFTKKNTTFVLIIILLTILLSRYIVTYSGVYSDDPLLIVSPAKTLNLPLGVDFRTCVFSRTDQMLKGEFMDYPLKLYGISSACGQAFPILISPLMLFFNIYDYSILYFSFLILNFMGYILLLILITKNKSGETRNNLLIFYTSFLIGVPGVMGLTTGNVDTTLSILLGLILLLIFISPSRKFTKSFLFSWRPVFISIISGFAVNAKIFLLPFALITIFFSPKKITSLFFFLMTFLFLVYFPNLFGSPSSIESFVATVFQWNKKMSLNSLLQNNHSLSATLTLFSDNCVQNQNCNIELSSFPWLIFIFMLLSLIIPSSLYKKVLVRPRKTYLFLFDEVKKINLSGLLFWININKENKSLILLTIAMADAFINLIPKIAYNYRLYYSLPIIFILYSFTESNGKARFSCYLSMLFLIIHGVWFVTKVETQGFGLFDARVMNIFVILHFYFLIKSAFENFLYNKNLASE